MPQNRFRRAVAKPTDINVWMKETLVNTSPNREPAGSPEAFLEVFGGQHEAPYPRFMDTNSTTTEQDKDVTSEINQDPATILVCGSRKWNKAAPINKRIGKLRRKHDGPIAIITAKSDGAEKIARDTALEMSLTVIDVHAPVLGSLTRKVNREQLQQARNRALVALKPTAVLAFWDGDSEGTRQIIDLANEKGRQGIVTFPDGSSVKLEQVDEGLRAYQGTPDDSTTNGGRPRETAVRG